MPWFGRRRLGAPATVVVETIYEDDDFVEVEEEVIVEEVVTPFGIVEVVEEVFFDDL